MIIGVPKEIKLQEHRIGLTPESVKALTEKQHEVLVEENGGFEAGFENDQYKSTRPKYLLAEYDEETGIANVFDTDYEDIVGYAGQERRALLSVNYSM